MIHTKIETNNAQDYWLLAQMSTYGSTERKFTFFFIRFCIWRRLLGYRISDRVTYGAVLPISF